MDRPNTTVTVIFVLIIILGIIRTILAINLAVVGDHFTEKDRELQRVRLENIVLKEYILLESSYSSLEKKAHDLGLTEPSVFYLP